MKVMAIGAHPDDIEIFMYGLLFTFKSKGDILKLIIATDGAAGKVKNKVGLKKIRKQETILGLKNLGKPIFLNLPDGKLSQIEVAKSKIDGIILGPDFLKNHSPFADKSLKSFKALIRQMNKNGLVEEFLEENK